jgi:hypothetical protein
MLQVFNPHKKKGGKLWIIIFIEGISGAAFLLIGLAYHHVYFR